jgi:hypothetical protein
VEKSVFVMGTVEEGVRIAAHGLSLMGGMD